METLKLLLNALFGLALFAVIMYLAYLATKYVGKRYSSGGAKGGKNLEILEAAAVGKDSRLAIAKAGEKYLLIGITPQSISLISELSPEELDYRSQQDQLPETMTFAQALKINLAEKFGKGTPEITKEKTEDSIDDKKDVD